MTDMFCFINLILSVINFVGEHINFIS
jgi:hypothetical protein